MDKLNVLIVSRIDMHAGYLEDIARVDPRIAVADGTAALVADFRAKGRRSPLIDRLEADLARGDERRPPDVALDALLARADVVFGTLALPENLVARAPRLKWLHIGGVGIDRYLSNPAFEGDIVITNSRGALAVPIAEHVLAMMLALAKDTRRLLANQQHRNWERFGTLELHDRTVGVVGLGAVATEVARRAKGLGMRVIATRRSATRRQAGVLGVDELFPRADLLAMLSESDFAVIAAPLTPETRGMIGEPELRAIGSAGYLINVARGPLVDQTSLIRALREGWIAGAALDVFDAEPLPAESELWGLPNVVLSPHMAGASDRRGPRVLGVFCENLRRFIAGQELLNVISREKGY